VAKFEASGATNAIDIKPNVASLRSLTVGSMFTATRDMETNSRYGWGTSGTGLDTHLTKNTEWGVVAYLAQSAYGKNAEVWLNPSSTYITGCAGTSALPATSSGCSYAYNTSNGQQASTTGNTYGVYDMVGGAWEATTAYISGTAASTNGSSIVNADNKYKTAYTVTTDSQTNNYSNSATDKKGDAVYETSTSYSGSTSWYGDYSNMPATTSPWFGRGGYYGYVASTGTFHFNGLTGAVDPGVSFRVTIVMTD
jgi:hypothetical protein